MDDTARAVTRDNSASPSAFSAIAAPGPSPVRIEVTVTGSMFCALRPVGRSSELLLLARRQSGLR